MKQNQCFHVFWYLSIMIFLWVYLGVAASKTPSHVFQQTEEIKAEIELIRAAMKATDYPLEPEYQLLKKPIHVYGKGLEVLEKLSKVQVKLDVSPVSVGHIPLQRIQPTQVFQLTRQIRTELQKIKAKLNISKNIEPAPFVKGKKPSHVYRNMWAASYMLDALVGAITPSDVFRKAQVINDELEMIARHMKVAVNHLKKPKPKSGITPKQVAEQTFKNFYQLANVQSGLGMDKATIQGIELVKVRPSDVFDLANMTLAELVRIKVHLDLKTPSKEPAHVTGKKPADVLVLMELAGAKVKLLKQSSNTFVSAK